MEEDGNKFILQIRPPSYWRIELASPNPPGNKSLRDCLASVLLLDKTPCPFKESVPISLPPESLTAKKRRPWKPLRSYPSEPILSSESGDTCADSQLFKERWNADAITEHQSERSSTTEQQKEEEQDETGQGDIQLKDRLRATESPSWRTARIQNTLNADVRPFFSRSISHHNAPGVKQANAHSAPDSLAATGANQTAVSVRPSKGQPQEKPPANADETRDLKRRHTIGSSWHDAETEAFSEDSSREEASTSTHDTQSKDSETTMSNIALADEISSFESHRHYRAQTALAPAQQLRLRRKDPGDASDDAFAIEAERYGRELPSADADFDSKPLPAGLLSRAIFSIFYAIFSIFVLAFKTAGTAVISWCKPVGDAQCASPQLPSRGSHDRVVVDDTIVLDDDNV